MPSTSVLHQARASVVGALHLIDGPDSITPARLPERALAQAAFDPNLSLIVRMPAGVRLRFRTDAPWVELQCQLQLLQFDDRLFAAVFDVLVDGELTNDVSVTEGTVIAVDTATRATEVRPAGPTTVRLDLDGSDQVVEVWLPHVAVVELQDVRVPEGSRFEPVADERPVWIHHGSSISHCAEAKRPTQTWPAAAAQRLGHNLIDLGFGGQCMLDQWTARAIRDTPADLISLKLGINVLNGDSMRDRTFVPAVHGFLDTIRDGHPTTPITVITPIICPTVEDAPGPTLPDADGRFVSVTRPAELSEGALTLTKIRTHLETIVASRKDPHLRLLSGLDLFGPDDVPLLYDGLHPTAEGYLLMAERFVSLWGA